MAVRVSGGGGLSTAVKVPALNVTGHPAYAPRIVDLPADKSTVRVNLTLAAHDADIEAAEPDMATERATAATTSAGGRGGGLVFGRIRHGGFAPVAFVRLAQAIS